MVLNMGPIVWLDQIGGLLLADRPYKQKTDHHDVTAQYYIREWTNDNNHVLYLLNRDRDRKRERETERQTNRQDERKRERERDPLLPLSPLKKNHFKHLHLHNVYCYNCNTTTAKSSTLISFQKVVMTRKQLHNQSINQPISCISHHIKKKYRP